MTPTGAKEEEGSVWRRKEKGDEKEEAEEEEEEQLGSKPDKASEKLCADSRQKAAERGKKERAGVPLMDFMTLRTGQLSSRTF